MSPDRRCTVSRRRGSVSHEAVLAVALAITVLVGVAQMLALVSQERRAADLQNTANREAGNVMESLMSRPWNQLTPEAVADWPLSEVCRRRLPNAQLTIEIASPQDTPDAKRIQIGVHWHSPKAASNNAVNLVAWRYRTEETVP